MTDRLLDGRDVFRVRDRMAWAWERDLLAHVGRTLPDPEAVAEDRPMEALVNGSRWVVVCECDNVEMVWLDRLVVLCHACWNEAAGGAWRPVVLPEARDEIERLLLARPPRNRNWSPGETVDDLRAENVLHGAEV